MAFSGGRTKVAKTPGLGFWPCFLGWGMGLGEKTA